MCELAFKVAGVMSGWPSHKVMYKCFSELLMKTLFSLEPISLNCCIDLFVTDFMVNNIQTQWISSRRLDECLNV